MSEATCSAVLWVHTHFETGEPVQIDMQEWYGALYPFDYIVDTENIGDIRINVPHEQWVSVKIEWAWDEGKICSVVISPNVKGY